MSDKFRDRERAHENKYMHDEELTFTRHAKAARKLARWVCDIADNKKWDHSPYSYAETLIEGPLVEDGVAGLVNRVHSDLKAMGAQRDKEAIRAKLTMIVDEIAAEEE